MGIGHGINRCFYNKSGNSYQSDNASVNIADLRRNNRNKYGDIPQDQKSQF